MHEETSRASLSMMIPRDQTVSSWYTAALPRVGGAPPGGGLYTVARIPISYVARGPRQEPRMCFSGSALRVDRLVRGQHRHVLRYPLGPGLGALGVADPVQDRVPVRPAQGREELAGGIAAGQLALQVFRNARGSLAAIGGLPPAVLPGQLDLAPPGGLHPARLDQTGRLVGIDLRPAAARPARREALQPVLLVERALLAVDPAVAERHLERFGIGHAGSARALLRDLEPYPGREGVLLGQPGFPRARIGEADDGKIAVGHAASQPRGPDSTAPRRPAARR